MAPYDDESEQFESNEEESQDEVTTETKKPRQTDFTLDLEEIPITLRRAGDPKPWKCVLREMNGFTRDLFLNSQKHKTNVRAQEVKDFKDVQADLIGRCLYDVETNEVVSMKDIREFPSKVQTKLYELCIDINGLAEDATAKAKKR